MFLTECRAKSSALIWLPLACLLSACSPSEVSVEAAQIREMVPTRDTTAAYFQLYNPGPQTLVLIGASSSAARAIELHTITNKDGKLSMRRLPEVTIPAGERVSFAPGGHHLMVFGVKQLHEPFPIQLQFKNAPPIDVEFSKLPL